MLRKKIGHQSAKLCIILNQKDRFFRHLYLLCNLFRPRYVAVLQNLTVRSACLASAVIVWSRRPRNTTNRENTVQATVTVCGARRRSAKLGSNTSTSRQTTSPPTLRRTSMCQPRPGRRICADQSLESTALNHTNFGSPVRNPPSPYFGESISLASGFGPPRRRQRWVAD